MVNNGPSLEVTRKDDVVIVKLLDEEILEEGTINSITDSLLALIEDNPRINLLVSFANVKHFSSSGLGMLIRMHKRVEESKGKLRLCEIQPTLYEIFVITKLNNLFAIFEDMENAVNSFNR